MPKKKRANASGTQSSIRTGNISDISGNLNVAGGNITTHHTATGLNAAAIKQLFEGMYAEIDARCAILHQPIKKISRLKYRRFNPPSRKPYKKAKR